MPTIILNRAQLDKLLSLYAEKGPAAARALAPQYGINPKYVRSLASKHGVKAKRKGSPKGGYRKRIPDHLDPRWAWAKERGSVCA